MRDERVGTAERTEVVDALNRAMDEGHLALDEYDRRIAAVGTATYTSELLAQVGDLPPRFGWAPRGRAATPAPPARPGYARAALILGAASMPLSMCLVGWVFGILAIHYGRRAGATGSAAALIGKVFGVVGVVLSIGAGAAVFSTLRHSP
jgi:hypothetical protein